MLEGFKKGKWVAPVLCVAVFAAMLVFFTVLHPIPIMDEDDVIYTVLVRKAIPLPGSWNPSRMMPEVLMSLCGNLSALCTALGFGRFIDCQVAVLGAMYSMFITAYVMAFYHLMKTRFSCGKFQAVCFSILFLMLHFLIFRTETTRNTYMFHTYDACCVFYYTVSALLGCTLVMLFMTKPDETPILYGRHPVKESFLVLALYFELFSNLFGSVILAAYAGFRLLRNMIRKENRTWKKNAVWIGIVLVWLLAAVLEATGGRAAGARGEAAAGTLALPARIWSAVSIFGRTLVHSNLFFRLMFVAVALGTILLFFVKAKRETNSVVLQAVTETGAWGGITCLGIMLLCAAAEPLYAGRPEAIFPIVFSLLLLMMIGFYYYICRFPSLARLLPILLILVYSMTNTIYRTFLDSNPLLIDGHVAVAIENEIYESIITAAKAGETEICVDVIRSNEGGNWPHDGKIGEPMAFLFYKYGIIDHEIHVYTHPSDDMNERYALSIP